MVEEHDKFYESRPWLKFYDEWVPESIEYPTINAFETLSTTASRMPEKTALTYQGVEIKYGELLKYSENLASYLYSTLGEGEKVMLLFPNSPQYVISYYATLRANCTVVPVNPRSTEAEIAYRIKDAGVKAIITLDTLCSKVKKICEECNIENVIVSKAQDFIFPPLDDKVEYPKFTDLINKSGNLPELEKDVKNKTAVILYTGGTTGDPKGVELTHYNIVANAHQVRVWSDVNESDRVVVALPMFHGYGMNVLMNCSILSGATAILMSRFNPEDFLKIVETYKPTMFSGVPTMYIAILNHPELHKYDLSCFRVCSVGAAPVPTEVKRNWEKITKVPLIEGYGLTEAVTAQCRNPLKMNKEGSIGIPYPDAIFKIVDVETGTKTMPVGEAGELIIKSPAVMKGYYNREEETKKTIKDGWLYTGDIAYMDEDGFFYLVDRKKDLIIVSGFNVYPKEIEDVLYKHPKVMEAAVIGVPDEYRGEVVKAFVVLKPGEEATEQEIIEFCSKYLSKYKIPKYVEFRESLPKSPIGKILRKALRDESSGGR